MDGSSSRTSTVAMIAMMTMVDGSSSRRSTVARKSHKMDGSSSRGNTVARKNHKKVPEAAEEASSSSTNGARTMWWSLKKMPAEAGAGGPSA